MEEEYLANVDYENKMLLQKMMRIMEKPRNGMDNWNNYEAKRRASSLLLCLFFIVVITVIVLHGQLISHIRWWLGRTLQTSLTNVSLGQTFALNFRRIRES